MRRKPYFGKGTDSPNTARGGMYENYDYLVPLARVADHAFSGCPAVENAGLGNVKELLAALEAGQEVEFVESGGWGDGYRYYVKFWDEDECWPFDELDYDSEIGLHRIPLTLFRCVKCGKTMERRIPPRVYHQQINFRRGCQHEWHPAERKETISQCQQGLTSE